MQYKLKAKIRVCSSEFTVSLRARLSRKIMISFSWFDLFLYEQVSLSLELI